MQTVNMLQAKSSLSRLVESLEQSLEREILIARNGRPVARLVRINEGQTGPRIGVAKGAFLIPDNIGNEELAAECRYIGQFLASSNNIAAYCADASIEALVLSDLKSAVAYLRLRTNWEKVTGLWRDMAAELDKRRSDKGK